VRRRSFLALVFALGAAGSTAIAADMDAQLGEVRAIGPTVRASLDLRDLFTEKYRAMLQSGGTLHVRIQAEVWEDRSLWDKLVRPAIISVFRIIRDPNGQITVADAVGIVTSLPWTAAALPLRVDVAPLDAIDDNRKYYLRVVATVGTIEEREVEVTGDAVFGKGESTVSVARVGKLIFNTVLQVSDYLQSVTSEVRSRVFQGREVRTGIKLP
jgi:hypothetical protein